MDIDINKSRAAAALEKAKSFRELQEIIAELAAALDKERAANVR